MTSSWSLGRRRSGLPVQSSVLTHSLCRIRRQCERQGCAGSHGRLTPYDDGVPEDRLQRSGSRRLHRGLPRDHTTQEPAWPIRADETHDLHALPAVRELHGYLSPQAPESS
jgi:hypothetical protein